MKRIVFMVLATAAIIASCKPAEPELKAPSITSISPESGYIGDAVTIK